MRSRRPVSRGPPTCQIGPLLNPPPQREEILLDEALNSFPKGLPEGYPIAVGRRFAADALREDI